MSWTAPVSRRSFLAGSAAAAAAVWAAPLMISPVAALAATPPAAARLTRPMFTPLLHSSFTMGTYPDAVSVVLAEIGDLPSSTRVGDPNAFSLIFQAPRNYLGPQALRHFRHPQIGDIQLLAVPIDRAVVSRYYEVIVNNPS